MRTIQSQLFAQVFRGSKEKSWNVNSHRVLRHMYDILNSYQKNSSKALKEVISEIMMPLMKNLCASLLKCHNNAYEKAKLAQKKFDHKSLIDDIFTHAEVVRTHLNAMGSY